MKNDNFLIFEDQIGYKTGFSFINVKVVEDKPGDRIEIKGELVRLYDSLVLSKEVKLRIRASIRNKDNDILMSICNMDHSDFVQSEKAPFLIVMENISENCIWDEMDNIYLYTYYQKNE